MYYNNTQHSVTMVIFTDDNASIFFAGGRW